MAINERLLYPDKLKFRLSFNYLYTAIKTHVFSKREYNAPGYTSYIVVFFFFKRPGVKTEKEKWKEEVFK